MKNLSDIESFGGIDADSDSLLAECFANHEAYIETKNHKRFLVLGRKGSGKTAIFRKYLSLREPEVFTFGHTFNDYPGNISGLFEFSFVAYYMPGGGGYGGAEYIWRYKDSRARFNEASTSFRIHPGPKEVLCLKKVSSADAG